MPTRKSVVAKPEPPSTAATKAPARKPTVKTAARSSVPKARKTPPPARPADAASLHDLASRLGKLELAGLAGKLVEGWRTDLAAIVEANRKSYAGLQAIVSRQTAQIKEAVGEFQSVGKLMSAIGPKDSVRSLDDLALASLQLALADIRELAALAAASQRDAFEIMHGRVTRNIEEVQQLLRK